MSQSTGFTKQIKLAEFKSIMQTSVFVDYM